MTCTRCTAPTATGITLCTTDLQRLEDVLDQIPDALELAEDTIAKQDRTGAGSATLGGAAESEAPINLAASEARTQLWEVIVTNARLVLDQDDSDDLAGVEPVVYLRMSLDLIQHQDLAGKLLDELEAGYQKIMRIVDRSPDIIALGQCGAIHEAIPCPGRLRAHKGQHETRCKVCGATYGVAEMQQSRAEQAWDHYDTLSNVVQALRASGFTINPRSARRWAEKRELHALRYREDGVALYSPGQVVDAHQRMKSRHGGRRSRVA